jgi:hypothetical protein
MVSCGGVIVCVGQFVDNVSHRLVVNLGRSGPDSPLLERDQPKIGIGESVRRRRLRRCHIHRASREPGTGLRCGQSLKEGGPSYSQAS